MSNHTGSKSDQTIEPKITMTSCIFEPMKKHCLERDETGREELSRKQDELGTATTPEEKVLQVNRF